MQNSAVSVQENRIESERWKGIFHIKIHLVSAKLDIINRKGKICTKTWADSRPLTLRLHLRRQIAPSRPLRNIVPDSKKDKDVYWHLLETRRLLHQLKGTVKYDAFLWPECSTYGHHLQQNQPDLAEEDTAKLDSCEMHQTFLQVWYAELYFEPDWEDRSKGEAVWKVT